MNGAIWNWQAEKSGAVKNGPSETGTSDPKSSEVSLGLEKNDCPMGNVLSDAANPLAPASPNRQERRQMRRASVRVPVRLSPANWKDQKFEEVLATQNASRANLYVISRASKYYYERMRLRITFPFNSAHDSASTSEDTAEIVRLDPLPNGRVGIAILIQRPGDVARQNGVSGSRSAGRFNGERRIAVRHSVSAWAKLTELDSQTRLEGRCSDLSMAGCYIDTLNPFRQYSTVRLRLSNEQRTFEADAVVATHHMGMGMGLRFEGLSIAQAVVLDNWLTDRSAMPVLIEERSEASEQTAIPEASGPSDHELILKLFQLLESRGKLTQAEISGLLCDFVNT